MTAPAEDPRGGERRITGRITRRNGRRPLADTEDDIAAMTAAGRGDTDSGGEGDCFDVCQGHPTGDKRATDGGMRDYFDAQAAELAAELDEPAARPAGDRAQPTQELREAICDEIAGWPIGSGYYQYTVTTDDAGELADTLIAGPLAALLAKLRAVEELVDELMTERSLVPDIARRAAADRIRRALGGPS